MKTFITLKIIFVGLLVIFAITPKNTDHIMINSCKVYSDSTLVKMNKKLDSMLIEKKQLEQKYNLLVKKIKT